MSQRMRWNVLLLLKWIWDCFIKRTSNITKHPEGLKKLFFSEAMTPNKFQTIISNFHHSSLLPNPNEEPGHDPWYKIRRFYNFMNINFKQYFVSEQNISLDESMVSMKNCCSFIQYMYKKHHARFRIKKYEVCDSNISYALHSKLYSGEGLLAGESDEAFTQKVVLHLMKEYSFLNMRYHLYTDNFYTKLPLAKKLF